MFYIIIKTCNFFLLSSKVLLCDSFAHKNMFCCMRIITLDSENFFSLSQLEVGGGGGGGLTVKSFYVHWMSDGFASERDIHVTIKIKEANSILKDRIVTCTKKKNCNSSSSKCSLIRYIWFELDFNAAAAVINILLISTYIFNTFLGLSHYYFVDFSIIIKVSIKSREN